MRVMFITSSIQEHEKDWKSVFIGHMYQALSQRIKKIYYWGPPTNLVPDGDDTTGAKTSKILRETLATGGVAHFIKHMSFFQTLVLVLRLFLSIRSSALRCTSSFDYYIVNWLQNILSLPNDKKPIIVTALGTDVLFLRHRIVRILLRRVFRNHPTIILHNAEWMKESLLSYFGEECQIKYAPLGIKEDWFNVIRREPTRWISVSRITNEKVRLLLDWCSDQFDSSNKLYLLGPNQDNLHLPDWIEPVGSVSFEDLLNHWYTEAKALLFLSNHAEGRPQTIVEAMASGVPVICLDKPLYREFIQTGYNGFLVSNTDELIQAIRELDNEDKNQEISVNAQNSIKENIGDWSRYSKSLIDDLNNL